MKVFVTGSRGFVGTNLVKKLEKNRHIVIEFDYAYNKSHDITKINQLIKYMKGDVVIHLASLTKAGESKKMPIPYMNMIVMGTANVLEAMRVKGIKRLVYISSCGVKKYLNGNPYWWSKRLAEQVCEMYARLYDIEVIILRPTVMYGPHNQKGVINIFTKLAKEGKPLSVFGSNSRDFLHVWDTCDAIIKAMSAKLNFDSFETKTLCVEIGTGKAMTIKELAEMISNNVQFTPSDKGSNETVVADISRASSLLGWKPKISLEQGLKTL